MKRLTEKYNGKNIVKSGHITFIYGTAGNRFEGEAIDKLAAYEQAEEQGLLLRLPCKVGTEIYAIIYDFEQEKYMITETKIIEVTENCNGWFFKLLKNIPAFKLADFGVRVFLSREEAESKLTEMEGAK